MLQQSSLDDLELDVLDVERLLGLASRRLVKGKLLLLLNELNQVRAPLSIYSAPLQMCVLCGAVRSLVWRAVSAARLRRPASCPKAKAGQEACILLGLWCCAAQAASRDNADLVCFKRLSTSFACCICVAGPWHGEGSQLTKK